MGSKVTFDFDERKLESFIKEAAAEALSEETFEINCPHCQAEMSATPGLNTCPHCHNTVDLNLDINL